MEINFVVVIVAILGIIVGALATLIVIISWGFREIAARRLVIMRSRDGSPLPTGQTGSQNFYREDPTKEAPSGHFPSSL